MVGWHLRVRTIADAVPHRESMRYNETLIVGKIHTSRPHICPLRHCTPLDEHKSRTNAAADVDRGGLLQARPGDESRRNGRVADDIDCRQGHATP